MKKPWLGLFATLFLPVAASAQPSESERLTWTRFVDPTENAFAVDVPQGWTVAGGTKRLAEIVAVPWITVRSPDGMIQVFFGDPAVPSFSVPRANQAEGTQIPSVVAELPSSVALRYRPGPEFAAFYGPRSLATAECPDARTTGAQPMPELARTEQSRAAEMARGLEMSGPYTPPPHDAGIVTFVCQNNGRPMAASVIADTVQPVAMGLWSASVIGGTLAPPDQSEWAIAILKHILGSRQWNPQWDQAMHERVQEILRRQNQQGATARAQMQLQSQMFTNQILAQGQVSHEQLMANHSAYMTQMNVQGAQRNQRFNDYMARKSLNAWQFQAHIRNGALYRDPRTGRIFEVDP